MPSLDIAVAGFVAPAPGGEATGGVLPVPDDAILRDGGATGLGPLPPGALPGGDDPQRSTMRIVVSGIAAAGVVFLGLLAAELWALSAPLVPFPALALADRIWARSQDEDDPG